MVATESSVLTVDRSRRRPVVGQNKHWHRTIAKGKEAFMPLAFQYLVSFPFPISKSNYKQGEREAPAPCTSAETSLKVPIPFLHIVRAVPSKQTTHCWGREKTEEEIRKFILVAFTASSPLQCASRGLCFRRANCFCSPASAQREARGAAS